METTQKLSAEQIHTSKRGEMNCEKRENKLRKEGK
jgi:hypothetical protein